MDSTGSTEPANAAARPSDIIAFIGTGVMGLSMARHLLTAGYRLRVTSRTLSRAEPLRELGAELFATPREAAEGADIVCSMVGFPKDVEEVHGGQAGTLAASRPPKLLIDFTTSQPSLAVRLAAEAARRGIAALDAPVSGGDIGARNATLSIMVGGDPAAFERACPLFLRLGKTVIRQGGPGAGQHTKMVNQILIAGTMVGVVEGLLYAAKAGLNPEQVLASVGGGAAGSWTVANLAPRVLKGDFKPGFFVEHFIKDLGIALEEANRLGLDLPGLALAKRLYEMVAADGHSRRGTHALYLALARRQGVPVEVLH
ncbi:MAG: NAD(P)-dependent oxidoreductase [Phycisphaerae bacterium]|nr:NAD(P)-dependent oxidoreductase [Phycisphaerae bacterium]